MSARPPDDDLLDARLRSAAASLAEEPLPEGMLALSERPATWWQRTAPMTVAAGVLVLGIAFAVTQLGPPGIADSTPGPTAAAATPETPEPSATPVPSPIETPAPSPAIDPVAATLVTAGSACGDGVAGYAFLVPDGWSANRRWGETPACRFVSDAPFEVPYDRGFALVTPINLRVSTAPMPDGEVTEVEADVAIETADTFATRYAITRDGATYVTFVVPLLATVDGGPGFLQLEADASRPDAVTALQAIVGRLAIREPLTISADAAGQADALYAEPNVDACLNLELGFLTAFPESWWTNTPVEGVPGCSYLAPASFEIPDDPTQVPDGVAITIRLLDGDVGSFEDVTGYDTFVVDRRWPSVAVEYGDAYQVLVQLGAVEEFGPNLLLATGGDPLHRAVLDRVVQRLRVSPPPDEVLERDSLPSCGTEIKRSVGIDEPTNREARGCFAAAYEAGEPAELIQVGATVEGGLFLSIWRSIGPGDVELYSDPTTDPAGGSPTWQLYRCASIDVLDDADGTPQFGLGSCDTPIQLDALP